jgi:hypothetical protein
VAGNWNSGRRPGSGLGMRYWTKRKEREYQWHLAEQARLKEERHKAALERARVQANAWRRRRDKRWRAENKAAELAEAVLPHPQLRAPLRKRKPEPSGKSAERWRKFGVRQKRLLSDWEQALREDRRRTKRIARGLSPTPMISTARSKLTRERRVARREAYLSSQWFSPALDELTARAIITERHPNRTALEQHYDYAALAAQCHAASLNVNRFTIAENGVDGVAAASEQRAILQEITQGSLDNLLDAVVKAATISSLRSMPQFQGIDETWVENLCRKSRDHAQVIWGAGELIFKTVSDKEKK